MRRLRTKDERESAGKGIIMFMWLGWDVDVAVAVDCQYNKVTLIIGSMEEQYFLYSIETLSTKNGN